MSTKNSLTIHPDLRNALALLGDIPADAVTVAECWNAVAPKCPEGKTYTRWTFWGFLANKALLRMSVNKQLVVSAYVLRWYNRAHTDDGNLKPFKAWPPKALFTPVRAMPQPWDGKM